MISDKPAGREDAELEISIGPDGRQINCRTPEAADIDLR